MLEQVLHLGAVGRRARRVAARRRVLQQLHVQLDRALALAPLLLGELVARGLAADGGAAEGHALRVGVAPEAVLRETKRARRAV